MPRFSALPTRFFFGRCPTTILAVWCLCGRIIDPKVTRSWQLSPADFREFRASSQALDKIGAFEAQSSVLTGGEAPERIEAAAVSPSLFEILGMEPELGRTFALR
jgi:hypothetical protein